MPPILPPPSPKYRRVLDELRGQIARGDYADGAKLPSEADLVKRFGASRITVGRAVRELRELGLVERRAGSGTYVRRAAPPSPTQDAESTTRRLAFGLLVPDLGETEIFDPICRGLAGAPQASRFELLWGNAPSAKIDLAAREEQVWHVCQRFIERKVDGVFFAPFALVKTSAPTNARLLAALDAAKIPVVLLDRDILPHPRRTAHDLVGLDNRHAGHLATEYLLRLGRRRVTFVARPDAAASVEARVAGYREALFVDDVQTEPAQVYRLDPADVGAVGQMLEAVRPEALVCASDRLAGELMHSLLALGCRVPQDVALIGIDDVRYASLLPVPLTTVHQPCQQIGEAAVGAMLDRISQPSMPPRSIQLEGTLVVRASCRAEAS